MVAYIVDTICPTTKKVNNENFMLEWLLIMQQCAKVLDGFYINI